MNLGEFRDRRPVVRMSTKGGCWGAIVTVIGILFCLTPGLRAQGVRYDNIVLGPRGGPVASANIAVCAAGASTSSAPCSPLATIYSNEALTQPLANPMQADSLGNYGFWAAPGHYVVQIYGTGLTTRTMNVFLPCDPSNCSMSNATFSSITAGTLNLTGALTVNGRNVATEPVAADAVMYVSPNGNDSAENAPCSPPPVGLICPPVNNGLSWGSAKRTLYAAVTTLQATPQGGILYVAAGTACGGPVSGQGLWLIGAGDSSYSSPPGGWIQVLHPMKIVGEGVNGTTVQNASAPAVAVNCGSAGDNPPLWVTGTNSFRQITFDNLIFSSQANNALKIGISPNDSRTSSNTTGLRFNGDSFAVQSTSGSLGPTVDVGGNTFWIWFNHCAFEANSTATALSDQHQAVIVSPTSSGQPSGLLFFNHTLINNGGIHFYGNSSINGGSLEVNDLTTENDNDGSPAVWITGNIGTGMYRINDVTVADATVNPTYAVKVDNPSTNAFSNPSSVIVSDLSGNGRNVSGPMTVLSQYADNFQNETTEPSASGQVGFFGPRVYGQVDAARRLFPPVTSPWTNGASTLPSNWAVQSDGSVTKTYVTGPDGAAHSAIDVSQTGGTYTPSVTFANSTHTYSVGDYIVAGSWFRSVNGGYATGQPLDLELTSPCVAKPVYGGQYFGALFKGDGQWEWGATAWKVTTGGTCNYIFGGHYDTGIEMQFFGPVVMNIPAGSISDNEAADIAQNLASFPEGLSAGVEATLRGHPFAFGGSGDNYFATLDHTALTANRTYSFPDTNGAVCLATTCGGQVGQISISAATSASHSFGTPYQSTPVCVVSPASNPGSVTWWVTSSKSSVTVTLSASATVTFNFSCFGNPD